MKGSRIGFLGFARKNEGCSGRGYTHSTGMACKERGTPAVKGTEC